MKTPFTSGSALFIAPALLALAAGQATAGTITFEVDYLTLTSEICSPTCFQLGGGDTFAQTFTLDSTQLAVDGSYDVGASLSPGFLPSGWSVDSNTATAQVAGGTVTDLILNLSASIQATGPVGTTFQSASFSESAGQWSQFGSVFVSGIDVSETTSSTGLYTIQQLATPEPAGGVPAAAGFGLIAAIRRLRRA